MTVKGIAQKLRLWFLLQIELNIVRKKLLLFFKKTECIAKQSVCTYFIIYYFAPLPYKFHLPLVYKASMRFTEDIFNLVVINILKFVED